MARINAGDLVEGKRHLNRRKGIVLDLYESDAGTPYIEVYWFDLSERTWHDELEVELISESR